MKWLAEAFISRDVKHYFAFLFDRGYAIRLLRYAPEHFGNWHVVLESAPCKIVISEDRGEIMVSFAPPGSEVHSQIGLESIVYFLSNRSLFIPPSKGNHFWGKGRQFTRVADMLRQYIDQITPLFAQNFEAHERDLLSAQAEYNQRAVQEALIDWNSSSHTLP